VKGGAIASRSHSIPVRRDLGLIVGHEDQVTVDGIEDVAKLTFGNPSRGAILF
jgi:hypothetical protein